MDYWNENRITRFLFTGSCHSRPVKLSSCSKALGLSLILQPNDKCQPSLKRDIKCDQGGNYHSKILLYGKPVHGCVYHYQRSRLIMSAAVKEQSKSALHSACRWAGKALPGATKLPCLSKLRHRCLCWSICSSCFHPQTLSPPSHLFVMETSYFSATICSFICQMYYRWILVKQMDLGMSCLKPRSVSKHPADR